MGGPRVEEEDKTRITKTGEQKPTQEPPLLASVCRPVGRPAARPLATQSQSRDERPEVERAQRRSSGAQMSPQAGRSSNVSSFSSLSRSLTLSLSLSNSHSPLTAKCAHKAPVTLCGQLARLIFNLAPRACHSTPSARPQPATWRRALEAAPIICCKLAPPLSCSALPLGDSFLLFYFRLLFGARSQREREKTNRRAWA